MRSRIFLAALVTLSAYQTAHAMPAMDRSVPVPVSRLVQNVSAYIKKHPQDAEGYYTLARVHSIAFAQSFIIPGPVVPVFKGTKKVAAETVGPPQKAIKAIPANSKDNFHNRELPDVQGYGSVTRDKPNQAITSEDLFHIKESVRDYTKATALAPKDSTCWLGLGWMLEQGAPFAKRLGAPWKDSPASPQTSISSDWVNRAIAAYRHTYQLELGHQDVNYYDTLAIEAGESILRLQPRSSAPQTPAELAGIRNTIAKIKKKPMVISPIILPLSEKSSLASLLSPHRSVSFNLSGDGLGKRWPWVGADTGILVWDPQHTGRITSGRQLFGSVTWWIFWDDGYKALAALDNNGDGQLTASELNGISIWRDADGNGVSDAGEVKPLQDWGIVALSTKVTEHVDGMPSNLRGARRTDGSLLPTYDWTPRSLN